MCHNALYILPQGLPVGKGHGPHHHLRENTTISTACTLSADIDVDLTSLFLSILLF